MLCGSCHICRHEIPIFNSDSMKTNKILIKKIQVIWSEQNTSKCHSLPLPQNYAMTEE
jgi:hypothetical protein